jgi:hypothetical protein
MKWLLIAVLWIVGVAPPPQTDTLDPGYWERTPLPQTGLATFYAPGMMEHVLAVRAGHGQILRCDECVGTVALLRAGDIGRRVWLQPPGGEKVGPFLVIDCAQREDIPMLVGRNWVVDVSYELGQLWGMDRPLDGVTVLADPATDGSSAMAGVAAPPTPFYVPPDRVVLSTPTPAPRISPTPWQPTPWPTRLPVALAPIGGASSVLPTPETPATPPRPTPLTPVVTTPTPRAPAETGVAAVPTSQAPTPTEVAIGRPGAGLLILAGTPTARPVWTPTPSPTATRGRPTVGASRPLLPRLPTATPTPPASNAAGLLEWLGALLGITGP